MVSLEHLGGFHVSHGHNPGTLYAISTCSDAFAFKKLSDSSECLPNSARFCVSLNLGLSLCMLVCIAVHNGLVLWVCMMAISLSIPQRAQHVG